MKHTYRYGYRYPYPYEYLDVIFSFKRYFLTGTGKTHQPVAVTCNGFPPLEKHRGDLSLLRENVPYGEAVLFQRYYMN